jgi:hypothetical protein
MNKYALVNKTTGLVENTTLWNGVSNWEPPTGYEVIQSDTANIGDTYANGKFTPPVIVIPPKTLEEEQSDKLAKLAQSYSTAIYADIDYTTTGGVTQTFQADQYSQNMLTSQLAVYVTAGAALPSGYAWTAKDNTQVPFTVDDLKSLAAEIGNRGAAAFFKLQTLKAQVRAATTVADVHVVVWS